jgi:CDGSH-type Zn-finger protein
MKIKIIANGPYKVSGDVPMQGANIIADEEGISTKWGKGKVYSHGEGESYMLCRCGRSKNKPYCDGSHVNCKFHSEEVEQVSNVEVFEGATVDLLDDQQYCSSMRFCDRGPRVWAAAVHSDRFEELAIQECADCASGRLTIRRKDGTLVEPNLPKEISPIQDLPQNFKGPLWVKGGIELEGADGRKYPTRNRMTLCRCGQSDNMPFCDTSHFNCPHMQEVDENE